MLIQNKMYSLVITAI